MTEIREEVTLEGHIIDSWTLPKVFDAVMDLGGSFDLEEIRVGRKKRRDLLRAPDRSCANSPKP